MDDGLVKQWQVTEALLRQAASEISESDKFVVCNDFLSHNELELALDVLEDAGQSYLVSPEFWRSLMKAAKLMGLSERCTVLSEQIRSAGSAAQFVVSSKKKIGKTWD